jgi:hypothetical protein
MPQLKESEFVSIFCFFKLSSVTQSMAITAGGAICLSICYHLRKNPFIENLVEELHALAENIVVFRCLLSENGRDSTALSDSGCTEKGRESQLRSSP